jgi:GNAT superfamily N-acetyltransferase
MSHLKSVAPTDSLSITPIVPADLPHVLKMLQELATYEEVKNPVRSSVESLDTAMFGTPPRLFGFIARRTGEPVGIILTYETCSTFSASPKIFIEDFFVRADRRGGGVGRALLVAVARRCLARGYAGLHWRVLDGNTPAIRFYAALGAAVSTEHRNCSLTGRALEAVVQGSAQAPNPALRFAIGDGRLTSRGRA